MLKAGGLRYQIPGLEMLMYVIWLAKQILVNKDCKKCKIQVFLA